MSSSQKPALNGVILAGGSGTRLWPLSTQAKPKQFLKLASDRSLIQQTADRLSPLVDSKNLWVVCGRAHAQGMKRDLPEMPEGQILVEPQAKNTAAAIALAAIALRERDPKAVMVVLPADHSIPRDDWEKFRQTLDFGARLARDKGVLVTLGIKPRDPATGYGYIEKGEVLTEGTEPRFKVRSFREKPDAKQAQEYFSSGNFFWNSGMFLWSVETYLAELAKHLPATAKAFEELSGHLGKNDWEAALQKAFSMVENISVDYAVMEKSERTVVLPAAFAWDDVGSYSSFEEILPADAQGNHFQGEIVTLDSANNIVLSSGTPIALIGVQGLIVVQTPQGVLVLPKEREQDVKKVVEALRERGKLESL